jgi:hypothetical protein
MKKLPGDTVAENLAEVPPSRGASTPTIGGINPPTSGDMKSNVSSFIPAGLGSTLSQIQNPTTFGDQLANQAKQQVIAVILGPIQKLKAEIEKVINDRIKLETDHVNTLLDLTNKSIATITYDPYGTSVTVPPVLSPDEYQAAIIKENTSYEASKIINDNDRKRLEERFQKLILDPYNKIKKDITDFTKSKDTLKTRIKGLKGQMDKQKLQQLTLNIAKTIIVTTSSLLTQQLITTISNNSSLQDLVNKTNVIIDAAETIDQINQARIARNGCINKINQQEARIQAAIKVLNTINVILTVFNILNRILTLLNIPSPLGVAAKPLAILNVNAAKILDGISAAVCILIPILNGAVYVLEDLKRQLRDINQKIEEKTLALLSDVDLTDYLDQIKYSSDDPINNINLQDLNTLSGLINQPINPISNNLGAYKGFTFFTREENDPKFNVRGNKRHYVVAVDTKNVERIKSDYSFTLNPTQLVTQLKLVIDQQNLQG